MALQRCASRSLLPLSEVTDHAAAMWCRGTNQKVIEGIGLAPFALPAGAPQAVSLGEWLVNDNITALEDGKAASHLFCSYHQQMLESFGVAFGAGGICIRELHGFPLLALLAHTEDYIGRLDFGLLPFGGSFKDIRVGFIVLPPSVQIAQDDGEPLGRAPEYEDFKAQAICSIIAARNAGMQPFYLDLTDGEHHHIMYSVQDSSIVVHSNCTPREAYCLLSGLVKGDIAYGEGPDNGHICPQSAQGPVVGGCAISSEPDMYNNGEAAVKDDAAEMGEDNLTESEESQSSSGDDMDDECTDSVWSKSGDSECDAPDSLQPAGSDAGWQVV